MAEQIDLNCDLGEWKTDDGPDRDEAIMPYISSCNIACGGHIGDETSIAKTVDLALNYGVAIGAHPSYPDKENFGRVVPGITDEALRNSLSEQIRRIQSVLEERGAVLHHIKPHGALYNHAAKDEHTARIVMEVIKHTSPDVPVYLPPASVSERIAREFGIKVITEVFADRAYEDDMSLRPRVLEGAVLHSENEILAQLEKMIFQKKVNSYRGKLLSVQPETVCLHSDTPGATLLAASIHRFLTEKDVEITAP